MGKVYYPTRITKKAPVVSEGILSKPSQIISGEL
jgi:hypothetical protein